MTLMTQLENHKLTSSLLDRLSVTDLDEAQLNIIKKKIVRDFN